MPDKRASSSSRFITVPCASRRVRSTAATSRRNLVCALRTGGVILDAHTLREYHSLSATLTRQLRSNAIAIISLIVALSSFSYSAWRTERSERNRTTRQAAFQMLVALGEMKQVVYHGHYDHDAVRGNPRTGWVYVETIRDFSAAMPAPVPVKAEALMQSWQKHWEGIGTEDADADAVTNAIDDCRAAVVENLQSLR